MDRLDPQRIAAEQANSKCVVNMRLNRAGPVERLAEADNAGVGMDPGPHHVGEFLGAQCLDGGDFHGHSPLKQRSLDALRASYRGL